jgi:hypothetical protein
MIYYNFQLLTSITERDQCIVDPNLYKDISSRDVKIDFKCVCSKNGNKTFRKLNETGAFCKDCMNIQTKNKLRQTNQERYGVDNPFQSKTIQDKAKQTHLERYGVEHPLQVKEAKEKAKKTFQEKYQVDNPMQSKDIKDKAKKTNIKKYGVEHTFQSDVVKEKIKETMMERYGVENPMLSTEFKEKSQNTNLEKYGFKSHNQSNIIKEKKKQTTLQNYGVENPMKSEEVRDNFKHAMVVKYGVENPMQVPEFNDKSMKAAYKYKNYVFPCGAECLVQGYEPFALNILVEQGFTSKDIITDKVNVPEIWYFNNDTNHRYFPDIYIPNENRIIEVKSDWTYEKEKDKNLLKAQACRDGGYVFEFWIFDDKGNRVEDI